MVNALVRQLPLTAVAPSPDDKASLELTTEPRYFEEYTAALLLPHTDLTLFPSSTT